MALAGGIPTAQAEDGKPPPNDKVFVCKYVGTPVAGERLQTGDNPISVSTSAIKDWPVDVGSYFADKHGRSYVLAFDTGQDEPSVKQCPVPETPGPTAEVVVTTEHSTTCAEYKVRDITVTTPYVWNEETEKWELGAPGEPVAGEWVTSTPTAEQLRDDERVCPLQPTAEVVVTTEHSTTCAEYKVRDITVTRPYVWNEETEKWELGSESTTVVGEWVTSKPTPAQIKAAGLTTCTPPGDNPPGDNPPGDNPPVGVVTDTSGGVQIEAAKPVVVAPAAPIVIETSDGVQIAAANPLPSAARAGDADTGGQLTAGGFAALAALLAFGAAFVLRRREGEV